MSGPVPFRIGSPRKDKALQERYARHLLQSGESHLHAALRRLRFQAALARANQSGTLAADEHQRLTVQLAEARLAEQAERAAGDGELPIDLLARWIGLRPLDEEILLVAVGLEIDPLLAITLSALAGDEPRFGLTSKLLAQLFGFAGDDSLTLRLDNAHPLVKVGLLESSVAGVVDTLRPWRATPRAASFLATADALDPVLARCGGLIELAEDLDTDHLADVLEVVDRALASDEPVVVLLEGLEGAGRRTVAALAARRHGRQAIALDLGAGPADPSRPTHELRALGRECWLRGAIPVVARFDTVLREGQPAERLAEVVAIIEAFTGPVILTSTTAAGIPEMRRRLIRQQVELPPPAARERLWRRALGSGPGVALAVGPELSRLAERYAMTPSIIGRAAANARMIAGRHEPTAKDVQAGVMTVIAERFGGLATKIQTTQRWEDLVLPADTSDDIKAFVSRASHAAQVYDRWGFRDKLQRGLGLAALFSGPPGTGKTMVAGLIARALELELYAVDLSQVVSKWVGETEKQLGKIFDAATMGQTLLLFDEADALFAKRTDVKSSNDRYANLEVNYLLQKLEQFNGVAILTTNLEGSVDPAFKRRLAAEVRFYAPGRAERERLWRTLLPAQTPILGKLDFAALADQFEGMCGGHIRNAVLRAAFLAASEQGGLVQDHLVRAALTESRNMGKML